jgi:imidazolonepropionase-like amidohydrolase
MRFSAVVLLFITFLALKAAPAVEPDTLILTNVNIIDTRSGNLAHNMTVVIKNGRIDAIAKVGLIQESRKIRVINTNGKFLIPGLWDMHVHTAGGSAPAWDEKIIYPLYIANGITGVRDMGGDPTLLQQRRERIEHGQLLGPHLIFGGPSLAGGKSDSQTLAVNTPAEGRQAVVTLNNRGMDFIKILSNITRPTYMAIAEEARKLKIRFVGHVPDTVSVEEASAAGQRSIELLTGVLLACSSQEAELRQQRLDALAKKDFATYSETDVRAVSTYDPAKAHHLFVELTDNNTWQVPTLVWDRADAHIGDPDPPDEFKYVPASVRKQWDPNKLLSATRPEEMADKKKLALRYIELAGEMHRARVPFMAGSGGPDPFVIPGVSLHEELELLVQAGFSNAEVLQTATFSPALFLAKLDHYGVIEKGREADMVLLDGNPLENIRNTRKIAAVIVRGKYYPRADLDKILMGVEEAAAKE